MTNQNSKKIVGCVQHDCEMCKESFRIVVKGEDLSFPLLRLIVMFTIAFLLGVYL